MTSAPSRLSKTGTARDIRARRGGTRRRRHAQNNIQVVVVVVVVVVCCLPVLARCLPFLIVRFCEAHIESWKLPPRTPEWMPLDFCLWREIEKTVLSAKVTADPESIANYGRRLRRTAVGLKAGLIKKCLGSLKKRIQTTIDDKGKHPRND